MENLWLSWAKRLQSIASTGLHYGESEFDKERYEEIGSIANEMLSTLGNVPVDRIESLVPDYAQGYSTPKIDVRGAIFEKDKVLLVREVCDGLWTLPGGFADVGLSAGENVVKEIWEEANLRVRLVALYELIHKAKYEYAPDARDFYKIFFICENIDGSTPMPGAEISELGYFRLDNLPPLSTSRVIERDIAAAFEFVNGSCPTILID
jgi:ADP-ribose pyrophosphatase YjhB (NUDIX family)